MHEDRYGLPVTTTDDLAFARYEAALDAALSLQGGAVPLLEEATSRDPGFALAWALLGLQRRSQGDLAGGAELVRRATELGASTTRREQGHLDVLHRFTTGQHVAALQAAVDHLVAWPGDAVVLMQAHFLFNIFCPDLDRREQHLRVAEQVAERVPDDWYVLGELAFAAEEAGRYEDARALAERSLSSNPANAAAAHPLAHAYLETGAVVEGETWLAGWLEDWEEPSAFACHLAWHLALLRLADGGDVSDDVLEVVGYVGRSLGALTDGASLLWRLHLAGAPDLPWGALAELPSLAGFAFGDVHRALVLAGLPDLDRLAADAAALRAGAERGSSRAVAASIAEALHAFAAGDPGTAADRLVAVEPNVPSLGGSRAQLELVEDTTIEALHRAARVDEARRRLQARLSRRPSRRDASWLARL